MSALNKLSDLRYMRGVVFGLDRIDKMAKLLNVPHKSTKIIHVAGTNGKGSVVTKLSYYLKHFGYNFGLLPLDIAQELFFLLTLIHSESVLLWMVK